MEARDRAGLLQRGSALAEGGGSGGRAALLGLAGVGAATGTHWSPVWTEAGA